MKKSACMIGDYMPYPSQILQRNIREKLEEKFLITIPQISLADPLCGQEVEDNPIATLKRLLPLQ